MDLLIPHTGTVLWMLIAVLTVFYLLRKFAWKPILTSLKERDKTIATALESASEARKEMEKIQAKNDKILAQAKLERDDIIKEARQLKENMINEAKAQAHSEAEKIIGQARSVVKAEKDAALKEIKEQVANLSVMVAEKILEHKLAHDDEDKALIDKYLQSIKIS